MVKAFEIQSPGKYSKYAKVFGTADIKTSSAVQKDGRADKWLSNKEWTISSNFLC